MQEILHGVLDLGENAHLQPNRENVCRRDASFSVSIGIAQREHADDLLLRHLRTGSQTEIHVIERSMRREEDARICETCLRIERNLRQERLRLVERRRPLTDLEHRSEIADRVPTPHTDEARCVRMVCRAAKMHMTGWMDVIEIGTEKMYVAIHIQIDVQNDVRQLIIRIGNRRDGDERTIQVDVPCDLGQLLPPVFALR